MATVTAGTWLTLAATAASAYVASTADDGGGQRAPQIEPLDTFKEKKQESAELQEVEVGDESSRKRKKQQAKSKYKVPQIKSASGVKLSGTGKQAGVQI